MISSFKLYVSKTSHIDYHLFCFSWVIGIVVEKKLPKSFITKDGSGITKKGLDYFSPLIQGEAPVDYKNGLPKLEKPKLILAKKKLPNWR